jgi:hypothetical protein
VPREAETGEVGAGLDRLEDVAADPGGEEFGDGWCAESGQGRWAAHQLGLELAGGGDPLVSVELRELVQAAFGEPGAEGGFEEGDRVGVGGEDTSEDDIGAGPAGR